MVLDKKQQEKMNFLFSLVTYENNNSNHEQFCSFYLFAEIYLKVSLFSSVFSSKQKTFEQ